MSIQDLGSLGELIAAIATIATLVYLAMQIRQNTHTVRAASTTAHIDSVSNFSALLGQSAELTALYFDGLAGKVEADSAKERQFHMLLGGFMLALQQAFLLDEESVVDDDISAYHTQTIRWLSSQPGFQRYWQTWGSNYPPRFQAFVQQYRRDAASQV